MELDNSITLDLFEDKLFNFEALIEADVNAFLKIDLIIFYREFRKINCNTEEVATELLFLVQSRYFPSPHSWAFVDEWAINLFGRKDVSTANKCRNLLYYLFTDFENSQMFQWICERFALDESNLLEKVTAAKFFAWFKLWIVHTYPNIALFLLGQKSIKPYVLIKSIGLKDVISYLPKFMFWNFKDAVTTTEDRFLLQELAAGKNIRTTQRCAALFNKRMAHYFTNAPMGYNFETAVWYGIVKGLNGNQVLFETFKDHFSYEAKNLDFLKSLIAFFVQTLETNPKSPIDAVELRELLNFLQHLSDEQKGFSIKGWTLKSLRRRANQWQEERNRRRQVEITGIKFTKTWEGAPYRPFEGRTEKNIYRIVQLNSAESLFKEGRELRHCVGTYAYKCINHGTSIWSLREISGSNSKSLVTIEVNKEDKIVQVRRKLNAAPKKLHKELIKKWAVLEDLEYG